MIEQAFEQNTVCNISKSFDNVRDQSLIYNKSKLLPFERKFGVSLNGEFSNLNLVSTETQQRSRTTTFILRICLHQEKQYYIC